MLVDLVREIVDIWIYVFQVGGVFVGYSLIALLVSLPILIGIKNFTCKYKFKGWN